MAYLSLLRPCDVVDAQTYAEFCQQKVGTPIPTSVRDVVIMKAQLKKFFDETPGATYQTLVRTLDWCKAKRRRPATCWGVIHNVRWAWADGAVPELNPDPPKDRNLEVQIANALTSETDERWRRMLIGACGVENRRIVYREWSRR